jgi:hypothetical protein
VNRAAVSSVLLSKNQLISRGNTVATHFRSTGFYVAMAAIGSILARTFEPLVRFVSSICRDMACGVEKLKRELAYKFSEDSQTGVGAGAGLRRESHGYRQTSADDFDYAGAAHAI